MASIDEINTIIKVINELKKRIEREGCAEGKGEDTCKTTFDDMDDWCMNCMLETSVYFLESLHEAATNLSKLLEESNDSRKADKETK